jgi:tetratricopeptide (TPR) repeat protein
VLRLPGIRLARLSFGLLLLLIAGGVFYLLVRQWEARKEYRAAQAAVQQYALEEALAHLERCLAIWRQDAAVHLLAAQTARRAGRLEAAREYLAACQRLAPTRPEVPLEAQLLSCQQGELGPLEEAQLQAAVAQEHPHADLILEALALGSLANYRLPAAQNYLEQLLQRQPHHPLAYLWRGCAWLGLQQYETAIADFQHALQLYPQLPEAHLRLAETLLLRNRPQEALPHFRYLHDIHFSPQITLLGLARCWRRLGEEEQARQLLEEATRRFPDNAALWREWGELELQAGRPAAAARWLRRSYECNPHDFLTCHSLAQALRQLGQKEEADRFQANSERLEAAVARLQEIARLLRRRPDEAALYREAGQLCLQYGQEAEGLRWLRGALQLAPQDAATHRLLADYFAHKGQQEEAERHRQAAQAAGS